MRTILSLAFALVIALPAEAAEAPTPKKMDWSFSGVFGTFDRAAVQRGFQVYKEVCSACHSMNHLYYRHLQRIGYSEDQIKAIAATVEVTDGPNDQGEMYQRPGKPADRFKAPFPNENAARAANNGALPPDLSVMVKARPHGPDYVYALLTGYKEPPPSVKMQEGMQYNTAFPGNQIAMIPPLTEGAVEYQDGTKPTVDQMARDATTFLAWAAEPEMEARKSMGIKVILFLLVLAAVLYALKRKTWAGVH